MRDTTVDRSVTVEVFGEPDRLPTIGQVRPVRSLRRRRTSRSQAGQSDDEDIAVVEPSPSERRTRTGLAATVAESTVRRRRRPRSSTTSVVSGVTAGASESDASNGGAIGGAGAVASSVSTDTGMGRPSLVQWSAAGGAASAVGSCRGDGFRRCGRWWRGFRCRFCGRWRGWLDNCRFTSVACSAVGGSGSSAAAAVRPDDASPIVMPRVAPTIKMRAARVRVRFTSFLRISGVGQPTGSFRRGDHPPVARDEAIDDL